MRFIPQNLGLFLTFCCFAFAISRKTFTTNGRKNILLQEAVKKLLGFKESPSGKLRTLQYSDKTGDAAPQYMKDLYKKYKNSLINKGHLSGNTVRSIHAEIGEVNGEAFFTFNLSSLAPSETLLGAEIHLYKRKTKLHKTIKEIGLVLYEIAPHYLSETGKITMKTTSFGWQWYDVTSAVSSCLAARRNQPHLFALNFKFEKSRGKARSIALKKFTKQHSMPFLIVYSNDTEIVNLDDLDSLAAGLGNSDDVESVNSFPDNDISLSPSNLLSQAKIRRRRSLLTNEIPEDPVDFDRYFKFNIPQTHPGMLQARKESRHKLTDSRLIPYPKKRRNRRRKKKRKHKKFNKKNRKNKRKHIAIPEGWENVQENMATLDSNGELCGRRKLIVDFADIGWGEWIISPSSFEAHYCAGSCPFPLTKKLHPSNHATIQSIVHAIGIYTGVPAPCCVPDNMSSVTLLYFDEDRNVVLKNYPSMTVESCACR